MSKLDYCFEQYKSPNVHSIKKRIWYDMLGSIPHQNYRHVGDVSASPSLTPTLPRVGKWYDMFHAVILSILDVL